MHLGSGAHIGVLVIPAVLALAQRDRWNGTQLLKGVVGGYEMAVALGESIHHSGLRNPHFRASGMIGAFGAAGAGIVADDSITSDKAMNALGFAVNFAAGMNEWAWSGGLEIYTHMGTASRGGITSIDLARAGLYSSDTVLEGKDGVFNAYGCGNESAGKFRAWLKEFDCGAGIMGARFKPVAGCNFIQTPLAVALRLSETLKGRVQQIESIRVVVTTAAKNYPGCNSYGPFDNINSTKMSIQYGVSAALILGRMDELAFRQYGNHELQALMRKCVIETDDSYDQAFSERRQPSRVEIRLQDGTKYQDSSEDVPWLDGPAVEERFYEEAAQSYSSETAVRIVKACHTLEDETTCAALLELLSSHGANRSLHRSTADLKETSRL